MSKYKVEHGTETTIIEADRYEAESLGIANVTIFYKNDQIVRTFIRTKEVTKIEEEN